MPFKTKLIPNYQMDWGKKYEKASYPTREKREVELFDIREFVKDLKKKKMTEMMKNEPTDETNFNPLMAGGMGNPLFGANPFAMNNPFTNTIPKEEPDANFDVDDLVKRIDAKIAELEEEERREKAKQEQEKIIDVSPTIVEEQPKTNEIKEVPAPVIIADNDNSNEVMAPPVTNTVPNPILADVAKKNDDNLYTDETDDDTFFDDFFYDDDDE